MKTAFVEQIAAYLENAGEDERIQMINELRTVLHEYSPFKKHPVDCVLWLKLEALSPNNYNPNHVAPGERALLRTSIETDGITQPVIAVKKKNDDRQHIIVDGFHRYDIVEKDKDIRDSLRGYIPVSLLSIPEEDLSDRMASTIRHNRARGRHHIQAMSDIVIELSRRGWTDQRIGKELGMDADEVLRLKQVSGLLGLFGDRQYSQAWTVK